MTHVKKKLLVATCLCSLYISYLHAQGITFEENLNWTQIKAKAKKEHKYIFVDCSATWCGPCKQMEKEVFPAEKVGEFFNKYFVSVKLQMDSTQKDNEKIQAWYTTAADFQKQYKITVFPSYLYFSPEGEVLNKYTSYQKEDDFIKMAQNSLDPDKQYYTLLKNYQQGKKNYKLIPALALQAKSLKDTAIASIIARDYINNYLSTLDVEQLYTKDNISFIQGFLSSKEKYFNFFYDSKDKIDKIMQEKGYAQATINYVIFNEMIVPDLLEADKNNSQPDWNKIKNHILLKCSIEDADPNIVLAKLRWYKYKGEWIKYSEAAIDKVTKYGQLMDCVEFNGFAWNIFLNIKDTAILRIALDWSTKAIEMAPDAHIPNFMDTKANLLYKLGNDQEAIILEEKAIALSKAQENQYTVKEFTNNLTKMRKREPTWIIAK